MTAKEINKSSGATPQRDKTPSTPRATARRQMPSSSVLRVSLRISRPKITARATKQII
jgi:hypothetical protein